MQLFKIKPLEWKLVNGVWRAATPAGHYYVTETVEGWKWYCDLPGYQAGPADSLDHGKELANNDWLARISPALEAVPEATAEESSAVQPEPDRELLDALKGVIRIADRDTVEFAAARAAVAKAEGGQQ